MVDAGKVPLPAWAHSCGILRLSALAPETSGSDMADRFAITERIARYCWSYDERQIDQLRACFTEDAIWEGSVLGQVKIGPFTGKDHIVAWLSDFWPHQKDQRRHMLVNTIVEELSDDQAVTLSYLLLMASSGDCVSLETTGFYRTTYRKTGADWKISRLTAGFDKPFWPGKLEKLSNRARARHGVGVAT